MQYRGEIDGLRAIAVVPVLLFHAGFDFASGGFLGVDIFFVISGYLITTIILQEHARGTFTLGHFYERRIRRILPALFVVVSTSFVFGWLLLMPRDMEAFSQSLTATATFWSNILFWKESGYFDTAAELKPLLHTWSLAVEEQYYILFPLLLLATLKRGRPATVLILAALYLGSLLLAEWAVSRPNQPQLASAAFFLLPMRAWELLTGALCALYLLRGGHAQTGASQALSLAGLGMIAVPVLLYDATTPTPGLWTLIPVTGAALIILYAGPGTLTRHLLAARIPVAVGLISYSLYLWHQPVLVYLRQATNSVELSGSLRFTGLFITTILAWLTWRYIEAPFRSRSQFSSRRVIQLAAAGTFGLVLIGVLGKSSDGFPARSTERHLAGDIGHEEFHLQVDRRFEDCAPQSVRTAALHWNEFVRCKQSRRGQADVILLGDSHAEHLFPGLADALPQRNVAFYIQNALPYPEQPEFAAILDELFNNDQAQLVLLTMHYYERLGGKASIDEFYEAWHELLTRLQASNKRVVLLGDIPRYSREPDSCVYRLPLTRGAPGKSICTISRREAELQQEVYLEVLRKLARLHEVQLILLDDALCTTSHCSMLDKETILYRDSNHLNLPGSDLLGRFIATKLGDNR